jgi:hypothetical protein
MNRSRNSRAGSLRSFTSTPGPVTLIVRLIEGTETMETDPMAKSLAKFRAVYCSHFLVLLEKLFVVSLST